MKDFNTWNVQKTHIDINNPNRFYKERDIWWCTLGLNIGSEQDGKDRDFQRPVLIIKSFGHRICLIVPLTTSQKINKLRFPLGIIEGKNSKALLSQIRVIDTKRLTNKMTALDKCIFVELQENLSALITDRFSKFSSLLTRQARRHLYPQLYSDKELCQTRNILYDVPIMTTIKVFGHISPDTDATSCAIIWAWYLNIHTTHKAEAYVLGELNKETKFVLNRWGQTEPSLLEAVSSDDKVVIVDTNNPQELLAGVNEADILQIIDHHKLVGGLMTKGPIEMTIRPVASTATVMHDLMGTHAETMPEDIAGVMLSCILSDTLEFRSPTTTPHDKAIAEKLATRLGLHITEYANEMFKAKSDVSDFTDSGLVHLDSKKFEVGDKNIRVSVVETTDPASVLARKAGIVAAIEEEKSKDAGIDDVLFFIVDILREEATVFTHNDFLLS